MSAAEPDLAALAADEFARRRDNALRKIAACELDPAAGEALLLPWLALACRMGANCREFEPALEDLRRAGGPEKPGLREKTIRAIVASDICPTELLRQTVATARDAAIEKTVGIDGHSARHERALGLIRLAEAVTAPPYRPAPRGAAAHEGARKEAA